MKMRSREENAILQHSNLKFLKTTEGASRGSSNARFRMRNDGALFISPRDHHFGVAAIAGLFFVVYNGEEWAQIVRFKNFVFNIEV